MDALLQSLARHYRAQPTDELAHRIAGLFARTLTQPQIITDMRVAQYLLNDDQDWWPEDAQQLPVHIEDWLDSQACFAHRDYFERIVYIGEEMPAWKAQNMPPELAAAINEAKAFGFSYINFYIE